MARRKDTNVHIGVGNKFIIQCTVNQYWINSQITELHRNDNRVRIVISDKTKLANHIPVWICYKR